MKTVALMPVKNEAWILDYTLGSLKKFVDEVVVLNDGSIDESSAILEQYGVRVVVNSTEEQNFSQKRNLLLEEGRALGGTHFVFLDADEVFSLNFFDNMETYLRELSPGQKLQMRWLSLWASPFHYRDDSSVWSGMWKDFIFCDDGTSTFEDRWIHEGRTPGENSADTLLQLPFEKGSVLHFQFVNWKRYQLKQAWYRCMELIKGVAPIRINRTYMYTVDKRAICTLLPSSWLPMEHFPQGIEENRELSWHYFEIVKLFDRHGITFFERVEIWHIEELSALFYKRTGHYPSKKSVDVLMKAVAKMYYTVKGLKK